MMAREELVSNSVIIFIGVVSFGVQEVEKERRNGIARGQKERGDFYVV